MRIKKQKGLALLFDVVLIIISIILFEIDDILPICTDHLWGCWWIRDSIVQPIGLLSLTLFSVLLVLLFLKDQIFLVWKKFAVLYLPIALGLVILSSFADTGSGFGIGLFGYPDPEIAAWWASGIFFIWSLVIIIKESLKLRGK